MNGEYNDFANEELVTDRIQLKMDSTECGLVWGVWFVWVVEEGIISLW